jgi:hypothetical protein
MKISRKCPYCNKTVYRLLRKDISMPKFIFAKPKFYCPCCKNKIARFVNLWKIILLFLVIFIITGFVVYIELSLFESYIGVLCAAISSTAISLWISFVYASDKEIIRWTKSEPPIDS